MATQRITMRKICEILRLHHGAGLSQRQIARSLQIGVATVSAYLRRAEAAGLGWPLPEGMTAAMVEARLFPPAQPTASTRAALDFAWIHQELGRKGVTLQLLWEEYHAQHPTASYCYSRFCVLYRQWRQRLHPRLRLRHQAGEKLFVDYAGQTIPIVHPTEGSVRAATLFVAVLGFSNYTYAEATWTQSLPDWIGSHVRALQFLGGVPRLLIPDNLKAGVSKACRYEPDLNPTYADFAAYYGTAVLPARPYKPRDKAKVEVGVQIVERWIVARLRHQTFSSLPALNAAIRLLLQELNQRPFKKLPGSRASQFTAHERACLLPLPAQPYEYAEWRKARVHLDYHVEVAGHFYSVPHRLIHQTVEVRLTATVVELFLKGERIASHPRSARTGAHSTLPAHMPKAHLRHLEWSPQRFLHWAETLGPATAALVRHLLTHKPHPEHGYRSCLGLLSLAKRHGAQRLEAACGKALSLRAYTRRSVASILAHGLDQELPASPPAPSLPIPHENLRGPTYYH